MNNDHEVNHWVRGTEKDPLPPTRDNACGKVSFYFDGFTSNKNLVTCEFCRRLFNTVVAQVPGYVTDKGEWCIYGSSLQSFEEAKHSILDDGIALREAENDHWVTIEVILPLPSKPTAVQGKVVPDEV